MKALLNDSWPLILSAAAVSIHAQIGGLMLGNMLDDQALGIYAAAKKLMQWSLIATVVSNSIMPVLVDTKKRNEGLYYQRLQKLYDIMIWLAIGISVTVTLTSDFVIRLLYGPDYAQASVVLSILSWTAAFNFFSIVTSRYLITENLTAIQLHRTFIGTGLNIFLSVVLIPKYGIIGASVATLLSVVVQGYMSLLLFRKTRRAFFMFLKSLSLYRIFKDLLGGGAL
jgi:O-antigen/teichoic acid export membrane protein